VNDIRRDLHRGAAIAADKAEPVVQTGTCCTSVKRLKCRRSSNIPIGRGISDKKPRSYLIELIPNASDCRTATCCRRSKFEVYLAGAAVRYERAEVRSLIGTYADSRRI